MKSPTNIQILLEAIGKLTIQASANPNHDVEIMMEWCTTNLGQKYFEWACTPDPSIPHKAPVVWFFRTPEAAAEFTLTWS